MRLALGATLAAALLAVPAPAHATHADFRGGCEFVADPTPGGWLGGGGSLNGVMTLAVVPTDSAKVPTGAYVTASCELYYGGQPYEVVLGPASGTGMVHATEIVHLPLWEGLDLCVHVTIDGEDIVRCGGEPEAEAAWDALVQVIDTAVDAVVPVLDAVDAQVCAMTGGDVWSDPDDEYAGVGRIYDCPPYDDWPGPPDPDFRGGCTTAGTGGDEWTGVVTMDIVPTDSSELRRPTGAGVWAWCELVVYDATGVVSRAEVLGRTSGLGAAVDAGPLSVSTGPGEDWLICDHAIIHTVHVVHCDAAT